MTDSSLTAAFRSRGVPLLEFGPGAHVPLRFGDPGAEHRATRSGCGLYDFSFMGCHEIRGPGSLDFLHRLQTRNLAALAPGALCYTLLCRADGSVLNDATVWCHGPRHYWLFTGRREDHGHIAAVATDLVVDVSDISDRHSILAVQGPRSAEVLRRLAPGDGLPRYFHHRRSRLADREAWIARIGYSGELGYELVVESEHGPALWHALAQAVADCRGLECGFQAADALRIEAGYILFARELAAPVTPFELGLGRLVSFPGRGFIGEAALRKRRWNEPERRLVGLVPRIEGGVPPEELLEPAPAGNGEAGRAQLTSVAWSPLFGRVLGMGLVAAEQARPGSRVVLSTAVRAEVARLPFYDPAKRLPRLEPD